MIELSANALAHSIGYLSISDFSPSNLFDSLPSLSFIPGKLISSKNNLYILKSGSVIIRHSRHDYFIKELLPGALFGNLPLLGQSLSSTKAIAGIDGARLSVMDIEAAKKWIKACPTELLEIIGPRLHLVEARYYSARFQLADSRLASLLLMLSAQGSVVEGLSHEELGEMLGVHRETVTVALSVMESDGMIERSRKAITIVDKGRLRELSEY
jgi:CRP-like cAMP-binding protein